MKYNRGFTILELMVVISIIAILVGILIPRFKGMQQEANIVKAKAELKTLQTAIESWYIHQNPNSYPASSVSPSEDYFITASPSIVSNILYDPLAPAGTEYTLEVSPLGAYYVIWSVGLDGISEITGIGDDGLITGSVGDDIYVTNGKS